MMVSAGDATWAISEHVAGSLANMVTRMNNKANQLGMTSTLHCQEGVVFSGVAYSTARDQARLWESVHDDP
jgi:D-alanyl-D-alanine carboxypeptidase